MLGRIPNVQTPKENLDKISLALVQLTCYMTKIVFKFLLTYVFDIGLCYKCQLQIFNVDYLL